MRNGKTIGLISVALAGAIAPSVALGQRWNDSLASGVGARAR